MTSDALRALLKDDETAALLYVLNPEPDTTRIVGGAVRDALLSREVRDIDLATQLTPDQVLSFCDANGLKAVPTGIDFGTITIVTETRAFEITTLREDIDTDGRHAVVKFGLDWQKDAARRDFTINALYLSRDGEVHAPVGGIDDLQNGVVRFIGNPHARIAEDYLRIWRFFRFSATYAAGPFDQEGMQACIAGRSGLKKLSAERVKQELWKLLIAPRAAEALALMCESGLTLRTLGVPHLRRFENFKTASSVEALAALAACVKEDAARLGEALRLSRAENKQLADMAAVMEALHAGGSDRQARALLHFYPHALKPAAAIMGLNFAALQPPPAFPVKGADLMARGVPEGPAIGDTLKTLEQFWIDSDFKMTREELLSRAQAT